MSSGFLPFDDDVEAPIVIRETVLLTPDTTGDETNTVRLMPDTTEDGTTDPGSVRLQR